MKEINEPEQTPADPPLTGDALRRVVRSATEMRTTEEVFLRHLVLQAANEIDELHKVLDGRDNRIGR